MIGRTNINGINDASGVGAVLSIDAPTGSTITVSQGSFSKVLRDSIEISIYSSRYFYLVKPTKFGSWTVTATDGSDTATTNVTIGENKQYEIKLSYHVPNEYQEVEYIQSNGNQVINLGIKPTLDMIVNIKLNLQDISTRGILGAQWVASGGFFLMTVDSKFRWHPGAGIDSAAISTNTDYTIIADNNGFSVNGVLYTGTPATQMVSQNISVFQATTGAQGGNGLFKLYYLTLSNSGGLVRNLYPCYRKSDSVAGLWDKTNEVFYTNTGSGTFVVGPDVK